MEQVSTMKSLSVILVHIKEISKKDCSGLSAIKCKRNIVVWGRCSKILSQKLQKQQNRAACITTFSNCDLYFYLNKVIMIYNTVNSQ